VQEHTKNINLPLLSIVLVALLGLLVACAEPSRPQGGPKDTQAPKLHPKKYSTPNEMTNFDYNEVILTFDEWIKIQSAHSQVVISPPLQEKPIIKVRNKSILVKWKEDLKDSTTYIINFGNAIQDITEGNKVKNMKRVFSTGSFIDSLQIEGQIVDAKDRQPKEDIYVMLYRNLADSIPLTQQPFYFSQTDENGQFRIEHIKEGRYRIFALDDQNRNYRYDLPNESIGFLDSSFVVNDSLQPLLRLRMFQERQATQVLNSQLKQYGHLSLTFNYPIQSKTQVRLLNAASNYQMTSTQDADSMKVWFRGDFEEDEELLFEVKNEQESLTDTISVDIKNQATFLADSLPINLLSSSNKQSPHKPLRLTFQNPIEAWDSARIILQIDTTLLVERIIDSIPTEVRVDTFAFQLPYLIPKDSTHPNQLLLSHDWLPTKKYRLLILPKGLTDYWGRSHTDTLSTVFVVNKKDLYGSISAVVENADSTQQYIVQLVDKDGNVLEENLIQNQTTIKRQYEHLPKGNYTLRLIHDDSRNGRWDVGNYVDKKQAEKVTNSKVITLKAGWTNEMKLSLDSPPNGSE